MDNNKEDLSNQSPEMIAQTLFTNEPKSPRSQQIVADPEDQVTDVTYIFEILITIYMEGFDILSNGLNTININDITEDHIKSLRPWFHSIGFNINVDTYDQTTESKELYMDYYCKIMIRVPLYETFFIMKKVTNKNYHFLLNGPFLEINRGKKYLRELSGVFLTSTKVFRITFDFLIV